MLVTAAAAMAVLTSGALAADLDTPSAASRQAAPMMQEATASAPVIVARSCASECQSQHDRCRVETKGSRSCDEIRQRCLQVCLQRKKK